MSRTLGECAVQREQASHQQSQPKRISAETPLTTHWHTSQLMEEEGVEVGTVDLRVAKRARLILAVLVMERRSARRCSVHIRRMTAQAKKVDVVDLEQTGIRGPVRRVARQASLVGLHRSVFEDERPHGVGMALGADRKLAGGGAHLVAGLRSVRIMTVAALDEPDIDAMPVGPGEFSLLRGMASIAQRRLGLRQHEIHIARVVRVVTVRARNATCQMLGLGEVLRFQAGLMASGADLRGLSWTQGFEADDLGNVAAAIHVGLAGTVTALASMLAALQQRGVGSARKVLVPHFLMAGLADVSFGVLSTGRAGQGGGGLRSRVSRVLLSRSDMRVAD